MSEESEEKDKFTQSVVCPTCNTPGFKVLPPEDWPKGETNTPNSMLVECTQCGQRSRLTWNSPVRLHVRGKAPETPPLDQPKIGDALRLDSSIGNLDTIAFIEKGLFVIADIGDDPDAPITLSRVGYNEDGELCSTSQRVQITREQYRHFRLVQLALPLLDGEPEDK